MKMCVKYFEITNWKKRRERTAKKGKNKYKIMDVMDKTLINREK